MNLTYLLGAGASYQALPLVEQIPERLGAFADAFTVNNFETSLKPEQKSSIAEEYILRLRSPVDRIKFSQEVERFRDDILWLKNESSKHSSIDTFAKKLYLKKDSDLKKLKYILSCFFLYEQAYNFDKRYDAFFASILEDISKLPENIKIVSWNYDSQLEIAYNNFSDLSIENAAQNLNVLSKGRKIINHSEPNSKFSVFKLNGTTNLFHSENGSYSMLPNFNVDKVSLVGRFLEIYESRKMFSDHKPEMSFAWENTNETSIFKLHLKNRLIETDVLVIIGYSFPFFNRQMDKIILNGMRSIKKVYVQDPKYSEDIIEKLKGLIPNYKEPSASRGSDEIKFEPKTFVDQFFIPIEF